jgi:hypothetical protein
VNYLSGDDRGASGLDDSSVQKVVEHFEQFGPQYGAAFLAAIPEPMSLAGVVACAAGARLVGRHRRSR